MIRWQKVTKINKQTIKEQTHNQHRTQNQIISNSSNTCPSAPHLSPSSNIGLKICPPSSTCYLLSLGLGLWLGQTLSRNWRRLGHLLWGNWAGLRAGWRGLWIGCLGRVGCIKRQGRRGWGVLGMLGICTILGSRPSSIKRRSKKSISDTLNSPDQSSNAKPKLINKKQSDNP